MASAAAPAFGGAARLLAYAAPHWHLKLGSASLSHQIQRCVPLASQQPFGPGSQSRRSRRFAFRAPLLPFFGSDQASSSANGLTARFTLASASAVFLWSAACNRPPVLEHVPDVAALDVRALLVQQIGAIQALSAEVRALREEVGLLKQEG